MALKEPKCLQGNLSPSHLRAKQQEKEIAKRTGGRQTPGSGNKTVKGDVRVKGVMRIEAKTTKHLSFTVTTEHISNITNAVAGTLEIPCMAIEFGDGTSFVILPESALDTILEIARTRCPS